MRAAFALGSNLGDRRAHLEGAVRGLRERMEVALVSSFHETAAVGGPAQGPFLNAAVLVETERSPRGLLDVARELEEQAARERAERWGPRTLDVDLLLCDNRVVEEPGLVVPHPRMKERRFVLAPLAEIAADWVVPGTGRTVEELLEDLRVGS